MYDYYYRSNDEEEVIIQVTGNSDKPLSIRVTEDNNSSTSMVNLSVEEIDIIIIGLQSAKQKILSKARLY